jgi:hypothetical protein
MIMLPSPASFLGFLSGAQSVIHVFRFSGYRLGQSKELLNRVVNSLAQLTEIGSVTPGFEFLSALEGQDGRGTSGQRESALGRSGI